MMVNLYYKHVDNQGYPYKWPSHYYKDTPKYSIKNEKLKDETVYVRIAISYPWQVSN